ncbi:MAG: hydroxymethylbilane synthase, partial [Sphingopyxis sp.]
ELDVALADGRIDAAVHSMKDVETLRPAVFAVAAMLPRADVRDRLIGADSVANLPHGATIGTASPRRTAQLLRLRPDLQMALLRGNVGTRLAKIAGGDAAATLLAAAGLDRLGMADTGHAVPVDVMLPAPSQGAVGVEVRADDARAHAWVRAIDDDATSRCVWAERDFLAALGADCRSPVGALATINADGTLTLRAQLLSVDGQDAVAATMVMDGGMTPAVLARQLLDAAPDTVRAVFTG